MIEDILNLKREGLNLKQIADKLDVSIGKVQYRLKKHKRKRIKQEATTQPTRKKRFEIPAGYDKDQITLLPQNSNCFYGFWDVHTVTQNMVPIILRPLGVR